MFALSVTQDSPPMASDAHPGEDTDIISSAAADVLMRNVVNGTGC